MGLMSLAQGLLECYHRTYHTKHMDSKKYILRKKATIYQVTTMLATSKMSYFQVITTC